MGDQELYTVQEVADLMRVHPETILRHIRQKKLKAIRYGARAGYRITKQALEEYKNLLSRAAA